MQIFYGYRVNEVLGASEIQIYTLIAYICIGKVGWITV